MDFSKYDKEMDIEKMQKEVEEAEKNGGSSELEKGTYIVRFEKMELGESKAGKPMFKAMARIQEGEHKKQCIFINQVIGGTKNDILLISKVTGFLKKLDSEVEPIIFQGYNDFADLIEEIAEDVMENMEYEVEYDKDAFNNVTIKDAYQIYLN